jgi:hypothetical protein
MTTKRKLLALTLVTVLGTAAITGGMTYAYLMDSESVDAGFTFKGNSAAGNSDAGAGNESGGTTVIVRPAFIDLRAGYGTTEVSEPPNTRYTE